MFEDGTIKPESFRERAESRFAHADGFLFASVYAAIAMTACRLFPGHLGPRLNDIFLVGIVLTVYRFTWRPAALLLAAGLAVSAWAQLSLDGALDGALDGIVWFALVSVF